MRRNHAEVGTRPLFEGIQAGLQIPHFGAELAIAFVICGMGLIWGNIYTHFVEVPRLLVYTALVALLVWVGMFSSGNWNGQIGRAGFAMVMLAEYGAFEILGYQTFTTEIFGEFSLSFSVPAACALSIVLVLLSLMVLGGEGLARGKGRAVRSGPLAARKLPPHRRHRSSSRSSSPRWLLRSQ